MGEQRKTECETDLCRDDRRRTTTFLEDKNSGSCRLCWRIRVNMASAARTPLYLHTFTYRAQSSAYSINDRSLRSHRNGGTTVLWCQWSLSKFPSHSPEAASSLHIFTVPTALAVAVAGVSSRYRKLWPLTFELDLDTVNMDHHARYLDQRSSNSKIIARTHRQTHTAHRILCLDH